MAVMDNHGGMCKDDWLTMSNLDFDEELCCKADDATLASYGVEPNAHRPTAKTAASISSGPTRTIISQKRMPDEHEKPIGYVGLKMIPPILMSWDEQRLQTSLGRMHV